MSFIYFCEEEVVLEGGRGRRGGRGEEGDSRAPPKACEAVEFFLLGRGRGRGEGGLEKGQRDGRGGDGRGKGKEGMREPASKNQQHQTKFLFLSWLFFEVFHLNHPFFGYKDQPHLNIIML